MNARCGLVVVTLLLGCADDESPSGLSSTQYSTGGLVRTKLVLEGARRQWAGRGRQRPGKRAARAAMLPEGSAAGARAAPRAATLPEGWRQPEAHPAALVAPLARRAAMRPEVG